MATTLTALGIGQLKRPGKYYDGAHGLFLQVYPSGAKCWQQRLTVSPGRRRTLGLGGYPAVGLADVRAAACKNWLLLRDGGDPCASSIRCSRFPSSVLGRARRPGTCLVHPCVPDLRSIPSTHCLARSRTRRFVGSSSRLTIEWCPLLASAPSRNATSMICCTSAGSSNTGEWNPAAGVPCGLRKERVRCDAAGDRDHRPERLGTISESHICPMNQSGFGLLLAGSDRADKGAADRR